MSIVSPLASVTMAFFVGTFPSGNEPCLGAAVLNLSNADHGVDTVNIHTKHGFNSFLDFDFVRAFVYDETIDTLLV